MQLYLLVKNSFKEYGAAEGHAEGRSLAAKSAAVRSRVGAIPEHKARVHPSPIFFQYPKRVCNIREHDEECAIGRRYP